MTKFVSLLNTIQIFHDKNITWSLCLGDINKHNASLTVFSNKNFLLTTKGNFEEIYVKLFAFLCKFIGEYFQKKFSSLNSVECYTGEYNAIYYRENKLTIQINKNEEKLNELKDLKLFDINDFTKKEFIVDFRIIDKDLFFIDNEYRISEYIKSGKPYLIGQNGFALTKWQNFYIFFEPQPNTIFHPIEKQSIRIGEDMKIETIDETIKTKETKESKIKYGFVRRKGYDNYNENIVKFLLNKHKVDRLFDQCCNIYWIDPDCGLIKFTLEKDKMFDEITQTDVNFIHQYISYNDPKARISMMPKDIYGAKTLLWTDDNAIDFYHPRCLPDGEYIDCLTNKKFKVKNGLIQEKEVKYHLLQLPKNPNGTLLEFKDNEYQHKVVDPINKKIYFLQGDCLASEDAPSQFTFDDESLKIKITIN